MSTVKHEWVVDLKAVEDNPVDVETGDEDTEGGVPRGKNHSGIAIILTDGRDTIETARVAFKRSNSSEPNTKFKKALVARIEDAQEAADNLNLAQCRVDDAIAAAGRQVTTTFEELEKRISETQNRLDEILTHARSSVITAERESDDLADAVQGRAHAEQLA